jgi:hypothetical protein
MKKANSPGENKRAQRGDRQASWVSKIGVFAALPTNDEQCVSVSDDITLAKFFQADDEPKIQ